MTWLLGGLLLVNLAAFGVYGWDKHRAGSGGWRVRESTLAYWALAGGWVGAIAAMRVFRHKTRKTSFLWKFVPACGAGMAWTLGLGWWWATR